MKFVCAASRAVTGRSRMITCTRTVWTISKNGLEAAEALRHFRLTGIVTIVATSHRIAPIRQARP